MTPNLHTLIGPPVTGERTTGDESDDARLLSAWRSGDERAFETLFRRYYDRVHRMLYGMAGTEADDLAQQVFLRLYDSPPTRIGGSLAPWLYRVATNLGRRAYRSRTRWRRYLDRLGELTSARGWSAPEPDPAEQALQSDEQRRVRRTLAGLSRRDADLLMLRYSGLSYRELARVLDVAPGSVGTLLARAEKRFKARYEMLTTGGSQ